MGRGKAKDQPETRDSPATAARLAAILWPQSSGPYSPAFDPRAQTTDTRILAEATFAPGTVRVGLYAVAAGAFSVAIRRVSISKNASVSI